MTVQSTYDMTVQSTYDMTVQRTYDMTVHRMDNHLSDLHPNNSDHTLQQHGHHTARDWFPQNSEACCLSFRCHARARLLHSRGTTCHDCGDPDSRGMSTSLTGCPEGGGHDCAVHPL